MKNKDNNQIKKFLQNKTEDNRVLKETLDIKKLSVLLKQFYSATGLANSIVDINGNILHGVGWTNICTEFHRKNKISAERCLQSDTILANRLKKKGKYSIYICQNGMVDVAIPIFIDGVHVANVFIGQFFFETPNKDFFIKQSEELGFDEGKYLNALKKCKVYNKKTILQFLDFFNSLINMFSESEELIIADKELIYQNGEKADRAAELLIADKELAFQNDEKAERAAELLIANKELIYQKGEKADRAAELIIANKELVFQIGEKADRAAELIVANKELAFQNEEKDKRAAELIIINKELTLQNEKISYINHHDFLTNLYNRIHFEEEKKHLDTASQLPISIIVGDVNGLKLINDGFGHLEGDKVLVEIAKILKSCCREKDVVSRIGGDEFGIFLPQTDSQSAQLICDHIADACKEYTVDGSSIYPSISVGHATKKIETEKMESILIIAEEAMSRQKLLESKSAHSAIIASIKVIMFEKSQETEEHAERLGQLAKSLGQSMSLTSDQLNELELLATLHDIGKMSIDAGILSKRGSLTDEEWIEMRKHPEVGFRIAQATSELVPISKYILCHHERWDGKGYPQGLVGEKIPLLSRILSIIDSYDAMTNDRSYRSAMTKEAAFEEIRKNSGTQFDPDISKLFLEIMSECNIQKVLVE
jgi:diguanylate cyclase (GGDEF)-like protein